MQRLAPTVTGFLDRRDDCGFYVHDWRDHCPDDDVHGALPRGQDVREPASCRRTRGSAKECKKYEPLLKERLAVAQEVSALERPPSAHRALYQAGRRRKKRRRPPLPRMTRPWSLNSNLTYTNYEISSLLLAALRPPRARVCRPKSRCWELTKGSREPTRQGA